MDCELTPYPLRAKRAGGQARGRASRIGHVISGPRALRVRYDRALPLLSSFGATPISPDRDYSGRHRFYRLANAEVGQVIESMMVFAAPVQLRALPEREALKQLRLARSCYDHLAGELGIAFTRGLVDHGLLKENPGQDFTLTAAGEGWFQEIGIELHS